jgi:hypothetical protein
MNIETFEGAEGSTRDITRIETGDVKINSISHLRGACGEIRGKHTRRHGKEWESFKNDIAEHGIIEPIFILKDPGEDAVIREGNHRLDAALELGLDTVPVEIRYFGHSEKTGLVAEPAIKYRIPNNLMGIDSELSKKFIIDGVSYELYRATDPDDTRGIIRIFDIDSGEVVTIEQRKTFAAAEKVFDETISVLDEQEAALEEQGFFAGPGM